MDRLALSQRIKGMSEVFASSNPISQDLAAMSYVLEHMSDEKFANILNKEYTADVAEQSSETPKQASKEDTSMYWNKEASDAIKTYLLKDVVGMDKSICCDTGRHLDKEQMPDATKKQEKPATLKEEQTPKLSESLDSKIVEKAKAAKPVNKEAGKLPKALKEKMEEMRAKRNKSENDREATIDDSVLSSEGVELVAPMNETKLSSEDEELLSKLFG